MKERQLNVFAETSLDASIKLALSRDLEGLTLRSWQSRSRHTSDRSSIALGALWTRADTGNRGSKLWTRFPQS